MTRWANYNLVKIAPAEFLHSNLAVVEVAKSPAWPTIKVVLALFLLSAAAWSWFGHLEDYTTVAGKLQPVGRIKVIEPTLQGQVLKISVSDGDQVKEGQTLVELDPTEALANRTEIATKRFDARAQALALTQAVRASQAAEIVADLKINWDDDIPAAARSRALDYVGAGLAQLRATLEKLNEQRSEAIKTRDQFAASVAMQKSRIAGTDEHVRMDQLLFASGWNSRLKVLELLVKQRSQQIELAKLQLSLNDAEAAISVIDEAIAKAHADYVASSVASLTALGLQIDDLKEQLIKADQALSNMTLRAPVAGVAQSVKATSLGQVVKPGQQLMEIVPVNASLEAIGYVANTEVGFVKVGQEVDVEVKAFPYATYGSIAGVVTQVDSNNLPAAAPTTLQSAALDGEASLTSAAQKTGSLLFPITVQLRRYAMNIDGVDVPLRSGMMISINIKTETRRAIDYVWSPLAELVTTSLHEWQ